MNESALLDEPEELLTLKISSRPYDPPHEEVEGRIPAAPRIPWLTLRSDPAKTCRLKVPREPALPRAERVLSLAGSLPQALVREIDKAVQDAFENEDDGE